MTQPRIPESALPGRWARRADLAKDPNRVDTKSSLTDVHDRPMESTDLVPTIGGIMGFSASQAQGKLIPELL